MILPIALLAIVTIGQEPCPKKVDSPAPPAVISNIETYLQVLPDGQQVQVNKVYRAHRNGERDARVRIRADLKITQDAIADALRESHKELEKLGMTRQFMVDPKFAGGFQNAFTFDFGGPEPRLTLEIDNLPIREAIKKLFRATQYELSFDDDVPSDGKVTLKTPNVRLSTALDILTQAANVNWTREFRFDTGAAKAKLHYRVTKSAPERNMYIVRGSHPGQPSKTVEIGPKLLASGTSTKGLLISSLTQEDRYTFACPHCEEKVVVYRPKAGPTPKNGKDQPAPLQRWKHCPLCGKKVSFRN